ncbi:MAG: hypothetical protein R3335_07785 [Anaerolineales bacterium]|nr:hypothetical protein [Anaerolineales bacterium]
MKKNQRGSKISGVPPIVARGVHVRTMDQTRSKRRRTNTKRRYDIALGVPGAEVRLPAIPHIRIGWRSLSGILVVLLGGLLYTLLNLPLFQVQLPEIEGIQRLAEQEINNVLDVAGTSVFEVVPSQLEDALGEAFPEFYDISVSVGLPASVRVSVMERQPVLAWEQDGFTVWVDETGVAFPPRGESALDVRVLAQNVQGNPGTSADGKEVLVDPALILAIQQVGSQIPEGVDILYDPQHGLGWMDPKGWQVFIGQSGDDIDEKLLVYDAVVNKLKQDQISPAMISVAQIDAPFYRLEQ